MREKRVERRRVGGGREGGGRGREGGGGRDGEEGGEGMQEDEGCGEKVRRNGGRKKERGKLLDSEGEEEETKKTKGLPW